MGIIYFIRHAESIVNITKEFSYKKVDKPLTPKGRLQAQQLAKYLKTVDFSAIYTSPLKRALETSQIINNQKNLPLEIMEAFREVNVGDLDGKPPTKENWALYINIARFFYTGEPERCFPGGENKNELVQRLKLGVRDVLLKHQKEKVAIVGHGGIFTIGLTEILINVKGWPNCGVAICDLQLEGDEVTGVLKECGIASFLKDSATSFLKEF